jgi:hypothetical protein
MGLFSMPLFAPRVEDRVQIPSHDPIGSFRASLLNRKKELSKPKPELKQFGDLSPADFERHPVWIACHTEDFAEPWFDETDEETFRPWTGTLPVSPSDGMLLVRATFELLGGSHHDGFLTPALEGEIGTLHPHLFVGDQSFGFWDGMFSIRADRRSAFYKALGKGPEAIFPIRFSTDPNLATGVVTGRVDGFYRGTRNVEIER